MGVTSNIIEDRAARFNEATVYGWTVNSPHTLATTAERTKFPGFNSLVVTRGGSVTPEITSSQFEANSEFGWNSRFHFWIYPESDVDVTATISVLSPGTVSTSNVKQAKSGRWTLITVDGSEITSGARLRASVSMTGLTGVEKAWITRPVILNCNAVSKNVFAAEVWNRLPEYLKQSDAEQTEPNYPLLRFIEVVSTGQNELFNKWLSLVFDSDKGKSSTWQAEFADEPTLRWLGSLLGVRFQVPQASTSSWAVLEELIDVDLDGLPEWSEWESEGDTWSGIEGLSPGVEGTLELLRWQASTAYYGLFGGSKKAIIDSAKYLLTGTKTVNYFPRYLGDAWRIHLTTLASETEDASTPGTTSTAIIDMVTPALPAGFQVTHTSV